MKPIDPMKMSIDPAKLSLDELRTLDVQLARPAGRARCRSGWHHGVVGGVAAVAGAMMAVLGLRLLLAMRGG